MRSIPVPCCLPSPPPFTTGPSEPVADKYTLHYANIRLDRNTFACLHANNPSQLVMFTCLCHSDDYFSPPMMVRTACLKTPSQPKEIIACTGMRPQHIMPLLKWFYLRTTHEIVTCMCYNQSPTPANHIVLVAVVNVASGPIYLDDWLTALVHDMCVID